MNGYIYVRNHTSYDVESVCKMGKTKNIPERDTMYATGEVKRGYFEVVFEVPLAIMGIVERLLQYEFRHLHIKYDAGTEFYNTKIIDMIEPYLITNGIKYKKLTNEEISKLTRCNRIRNTLKNINIQSLVRVLKSNRIHKQYVWNERDYQRTIINFSQKELSSQKKIYIELPTGGGKSYIVYNLFEYLQSKFIIIVSPRKIVNSQNVSEKYLQILKEKYVIFNYSIDSDFDNFMRLSENKILICCTQSIHKIYEKFQSNFISEITIWFDEAHWGIEDWIYTLKDDIKRDLWLLNIKYCIFTSASPNKTKILENEEIFGKLYSPVKINELIKMNWLSGIKTYVYSENKENADDMKYILNDFDEKKRKYGFSFHNKQQNAFNLFYKHYIQYKNKETYIKPFLLVSDNFTINGDVILEYNYRDIKIYENTINSIGYVVAKYSMGYDFNKLDYICFSDPKLSSQDIKQCIGRGIRSDELGQNGLNKEKILIVSLPVYIEDNNEDDKRYTKIIEVLRYLLYDFEIPFEQINFKNKYTSNYVSCAKDVKHEPCINEYTEVNDVKSTLLNILGIANDKIRIPKEEEIEEIATEEIEEIVTEEIEDIATKSVKNREQKSKNTIKFRNTMLLFQCEYCTYKTDRHYNLKTHMKRKHNIEYNESVSVEQSNTDVDLPVPTDIVVYENPNIEKNNFCEKCGKDFYSIYTFKKHKNICKGISNILECHYCHKVFADSSSKCKHLKTCKMKNVALPVPTDIVVDENANIEKKFFCQKCAKRFTTNYFLKKHVDKCKGISNILECHYCHKLLANSGSKCKHLKTCKMKNVMLQINNTQNNIQENNHSNNTYINNYFINYNKKTRN